jgi:hypothetical protein
MALALAPGGTAQRDAVIQRAFVLDHRSLADDHAHAVVDEDPATDGCPGMDLDTRDPAREMGNKTRQPAQTGAPKPVREPMQRQCMEARIAGQHLPCGTGGGIAFENAGNVFTQMGEHGAVFY